PALHSFPTRRSPAFPISLPALSLLGGASRGRTVRQGWERAGVARALLLLALALRQFAILAGGTFERPLGFAHVDVRRDVVIIPGGGRFDSLLARRRCVIPVELVIGLVQPFNRFQLDFGDVFPAHTLQIGTPLVCGGGALVVSG